MVDRVTIYDNLKERGLNLWDALRDSADEYFSSKPVFSPSQPFDMQYYTDGNYLPPLQDSVQRDVGNAVAKGVLDTVTNPVGYVKDLYYGIADPAVSAYENTSASLPYYGNAALQRLRGDDNTESLNMADNYSANAITSLGLLGLGIADVLPSGKVTTPVKGLLGDVDDLGFYSPTERLATTLQPKGTGQQYLGILSKGDGKGSRIQEEMQDMGLDTWLQNKGKVSRDEVLDYISDNRLRYGERVGRNQWSQSDEDILAELEDRASRKVRTPPDTDFNPKYQQYAQEGGTGYQENLLTLPERNKITYTQDNVLPLEADHPAASDPERFWYFKAQDRGIDQQVFQIPKSRFNSTGEVSRQEAKDYIIRSKQPEMDTSSNYKSPHYDPANIGLTTRTQSFNTPQGDSVHLMDELQSDWHKEGKKKGYKDDSKIAMLEAERDRLVKSAEPYTTQGKDAPPEILDKYNRLANAINDLRAKTVPNAPAKQSWMNQGIKKEINQTIADGKDYFAWTGGDIQADRYPSLDHQGVEGMRSFYDKDVKNRTEKIIKRLDPNAKVEVIELDNGNKVWGVKITDKMRDKVKGEGMPLYSIAPIAGAGLLGAGMMRQEDQQQGILY